MKAATKHLQLMDTSPDLIRQVGQRLTNDAHRVQHSPKYIVDNESKNKPHSKTITHQLS